MAWWSGGGGRLGFGAAEGHSEEPQEFLPSSSVSAVVTIVMSSPMLFFTFSTVISGKIVKSVMPRLVVPLAVELRGHPAEVADGRESDRQEAVHELPHRHAPQRDVAAR